MSGIIKSLICALKGHNEKDKGWGICSCRRCGKRLRATDKAVLASILNAGHDLIRRGRWFAR